MLLMDMPRPPARHRRQREVSLRQALAVVDTGVRAGVAKLMEHNLPLAAASGLLLLGTMANVVAGLFYGLINDAKVVFIFTTTGTASWLFALLIFCIFPPSGAPRHAKDR